MNNHDSKKENSVLYLDQSEGPQITSVCYTTAAPGAKVREEEKKIQAVRNWCFFTETTLRVYLSKLTIHN